MNFDSKKFLAAHATILTKPMDKETHTEYSANNFSLANKVLGPTVLIPVRDVELYIIHKRLIKISECMIILCKALFPYQLIDL